MLKIKKGTVLKINFFLQKQKLHFEIPKISKAAWHFNLLLQSSFSFQSSSNVGLPVASFNESSIVEPIHYTTYSTTFAL